MKRFLKLATLLLLVAALLSGCLDLSAMDAEMPQEDDEPRATLGPLTEPVYTDREAVYKMYYEVNIGDLLSDLTEKYGEPEIEANSEGDTYIWADEDGIGLAAVFYSDGRLRAKVLSYNDIRQLKELSGATHIENVASLSRETDFATVCMMLGGKPMEIAAIAQDSSVNPDVKRLFAWVDEAGNCAQVLFTSQEKLEQVSYTIADE